MQKEHAAELKKLKYQHENEYESLRHDSNVSFCIHRSNDWLSNFQLNSQKLQSQKQRKIDELNDELKSVNESYAKMQEENLLHIDKIKQKYEDDYKSISQTLQVS